MKGFELFVGDLLEAVALSIRFFETLEGDFLFQAPSKSSLKNEDSVSRLKAFSEVFKTARSINCKYDSDETQYIILVYELHSLNGES